MTLENRNVAFKYLSILIQVHWCYLSEFIISYNFLKLSIDKELDFVVEIRCNFCTAREKDFLSMNNMICWCNFHRAFFCQLPGIRPILSDIPEHSSFYCVNSSGYLVSESDQWITSWTCVDFILKLFCSLLSKFL